MRGVVVQQRAALQIVLHQEKPDRSVQQSVQSAGYFPVHSRQRHELARLQRLQVPTSQQIEVALRLRLARLSSQPTSRFSMYSRLNSDRRLACSNTCWYSNTTLRSTFSRMSSTPSFSIRYRTAGIRLSLASASLCLRLNARIMLASPIVRQTERISPHHLRKALRQRLWMRETKRGNDDFVGLRLNESLEIASQATLGDRFQTDFEGVQGFESEVVVLLVHLKLKTKIRKGKRVCSHAPPW